MRNSSHKQSGFTLVEVLVSLFIFSILSAATLTVLTLTLQSKAQLTAKSEMLRKRSITRVLLKADLAHTLVTPRMDEYGQILPIQFIGGNRDNGQIISLARTGWENPAGIETRSNLQSVAYRFERGVLTRHIRPKFNALSSVETLNQTLLSGLQTVRVTFFDGESWVENWVSGSHPQGVEGLPKLAAFEFEFENGDNLQQIFYVGADQ